jgi:hypothetical protein
MTGSRVWLGARSLSAKVTPSGWLGGTGYGLTFEVVDQPEGTLLLQLPGTFGHCGPFGIEGGVDPKTTWFASCWCRWRTEQPTRRGRR